LGYFFPGRVLSGVPKSSVSIMSSFRDKEPETKYGPFLVTLIFGISKFTLSSGAWGSGTFLSLYYYQLIHSILIPQFFVYQHNKENKSRNQMFLHYYIHPYQLTKYFHQSNILEIHLIL